jgi:hypothetical protein
MNRTTRFAAAAVAAALSFGVTGPAVAAGHADRPVPHASHGTNDDHGNKGRNDDKGGKGANDDKGGNKPGKVETKYLKQVLKDIANLDRSLAKVAKASRVNGLTDTDRTVLATNVAADRATLAALSDTTRSADSNADLKQVRRDLKAVRVQNYTQVINDLRFASRLAEKIADERSYADDGTTEAALLDEAAALLSQAVAQAHLVTATSDKTALREVKSALSESKSKFEDAKDSYDDDDSTDDGDDDTTDDDSDF